MTSLLRRCLALETLRAAFKRVRLNHGCPGVDGETAEAWASDLESRLRALRALVLGGGYRPKPLRIVELPKKSRGTRTLAIPCVRDRILQRATALVLGPILEAHSAPCSYAYRRGRSYRTAQAKLRGYLSRGDRYLLLADIKSYFDRVPHENLLSTLGHYCRDRELLSLVRSWLRAPRIGPHGIERPSTGLPKGSPLSPLLANLYLLPFDMMHTMTDRHLIRYADDFVVACRSPLELQREIRLARGVLRCLGLELHPAKTRLIVASFGFSFLGGRFGRDDAG